jgi:hypothetical protein
MNHTTHGSVSEILVMLAADLSAEVLADAVIRSVERLYVGGACPTRELLVARGAEMITAIRKGERDRLRRARTKGAPR